MNPISAFLLIISAFIYCCYAAVLAPATNALDSLNQLSQSWSNYNNIMAMALDFPSSSNNEKLSSAGNQLNSAFNRVTQDLTSTSRNNGLTLPGIKSAIVSLDNASNNTSTILSGISQEISAVGQKINSELTYLIAQELGILNNAISSLEAQLKKLDPSTGLAKIALHALEVTLKRLQVKLAGVIKKLGS